MNRTALKNSRFTELLMRNNVVEKQGFKEWVFCPGMLFNAVDKWWSGRGKCIRPHEGLDLCLYRNRQDRMVRLEGGIVVPAMYDGVVVKIIDDFLGKSVIIDHNIIGQQRFCSIYGHTIPGQGIEAGKKVKEGYVIASLADTGKSKAGLFPHLHITIGMVSAETSYDRMDWETIGSERILTLVDPLVVIGGNYVIEDSGLPLCSDR